APALRRYGAPMARRVDQQRGAIGLSRHRLPRIGGTARQVSLGGRWRAKSLDGPARTVARVASREGGAAVISRNSFKFVMLPPQTETTRGWVRRLAGAGAGDR